MPQPRVRFIGSRELHRDLPKVLESLENPDARCVLTIHSKPRAVLIGAEAFLALLRSQTPADRLLALQLEALVQGHESGEVPAVRAEPEADEPAPATRPRLATVGA
jgi:PHD/YefM family antitoxin component YafN of YafNO toxin-antitoxin module